MAKALSYLPSEMAGTITAGKFVGDNRFYFLRSFVKNSSKRKGLFKQLILF